MIVAVHRRLDAGIWDEGINRDLAKGIDAAGLFHREAQSVSANLTRENAGFYIEFIAVAVTRMFASGTADAVRYRVSRSNVKVVSLSGSRQDA